MNEVWELLRKRLVVLPVWGWLVLGAHQLWRRMAALPKPAPIARPEWGPKPLEYPVRYPQQWKIAGTGAATVVRFLGEVLGITREEVEELLTKYVEKVAAVITGTLNLEESATVELTENPTKEIILPGQTLVNLKPTIANLKLESIKKPAKGGRSVCLVNVGSNSMVLVSKAVGAGENVLFVAGESLKEFKLTPKASALLTYDNVSKGWLVTPTQPLPTSPAPGGNGTITVGSGGVPVGQTAVIVGDGAINEWKVKHNLLSAKIVLQFAEFANAEKPIASPFQTESLKAGEVLLITEAGKTLEAGRVIWVKMLGLQ